jgi:hypothetical protein
MTTVIGTLILMATVQAGALQGQLEGLLARTERLIKAGDSAQLEKVMSPAMVEMWQEIITARRAGEGTDKDLAKLLHKWFSTDRPLVRFVERGEHAAFLFREKINLNGEAAVDYSLVRFRRVAEAWKFMGLAFQVGNKDGGFDWSKYSELVGPDAPESPAAAQPTAKVSASKPFPTVPTSARGHMSKGEVADLKARCESVCTLLLHYSYDELEEHACEICRPVTEDFCQVDFPFNDVPECAAWDELRNCIYARHGRPFKAPEWRKAFEGQPWYQVDAKYTDDRLSPVERANVRRLIELKKERHGCQ